MHPFRQPAHPPPPPRARRIPRAAVAALAAVALVVAWFAFRKPEVMVVLSGNPDVVFVGTHGDVRRGDVLRSLDGGHSWRGLGCPGAEVHAVAIDGQFVYCGATAMLGEHGLWRMRLEDALSTHQ